MADTPLDVNVDNEMILIANLLFFPENRKLILDITKDNEYLYNIHKQLSNTIRVLLTRDVKIDKDTVMAVAKNLGHTEVDYEYLLQLEEGFTAPSSEIQTHIQILKLDFLKFEFKTNDIKELLKTIGKTGYNLTELREKVYQSYLRLLNFEISADDQLLLGMNKIVEIYRDEQKRRDSGEGFYTTGFSHFDRILTEGFAPKKITVVAARPGCGKSSFVYECARRLSNKEVHVFIFSLEMENIDIMDKYLATATGIPIDILVKGRDKLTIDQKNLIDYELDRYEKNPYLYICDEAGLSWDTIITRTQRKQADLGIQYVVLIIDLFGEISDFNNPISLSQQYELKLDKAKKDTKTLGIHTILVNQINRGAERVNFTDTNSENEKDHLVVYKNRPAIAFLKNSGKWEEVADLILLLFRAKYYDESLEDDILEVSVEKQRKGTMNTAAYFEFLPDRGRILPTKKLPYDIRRKEFQNFPPSPSGQEQIQSYKKDDIIV